MNKGFCQIETKLLVKAEWNYKENNDEMLQKLIENIKRNGQVENIIVREINNNRFEVVNGNHRLDAFIILESEKVFCYNLGKVPESMARRIAIETNETKFPSNYIKLEEMLVDISKEFGIDDMLKTMPFDEVYIQDILDKDGMDMNSFFEEKSESEEKTKELLCPHCGKNIYEQ